MKLKKGNTKKDFLHEGLAISFVFIPTLIYRRFTNKKRIIFFAWFWFTLTIRLPDYKDDYIVLRYKWVVDK